MTSSYHSNGAQNGSASGSYHHTVTALGAWSVVHKALPAVDKIKAIHVYDFDNTLFKTPLPNQALWTGRTIGLLASPDTITNGGWWHDSRILAATGDGAEKEEPRAWQGWWNENVVELVRLSIRHPDALCVLLTGRSESGFADLIKRMVKSKGLEFDMVGLKPAVSPTSQRFISTMHFKQLFLESLMETYKDATEIRIYEDRPKHVKGFREFLATYNRRKTSTNGPPTRGHIHAEVIPVAELSTCLDPVIEVAEVQHMINGHNAISATRPRSHRNSRLMIKKTVFYTGYMIGSADTRRLIKLAEIPAGLPDQELVYHGNNILICPRPCPASILEKVGGMGTRMSWVVTGTGCFENRIWAASLRPIPEMAKYHTDNPSPFVVLALRKGSVPKDAGRIQVWHPLPPEQAFIFETTVGEKVILRIEAEDPAEDEYESLFANKALKRKHTADEEHLRHHTQQYGYGRNDSRGYHTTSYQGRGGQPGGRGGYRGAGTPNRGYRNSSRGSGKGGGRGRGGHSYRSLDDMEPKSHHGGWVPPGDYEDVQSHHLPQYGSQHGYQTQPGGRSAQAPPAGPQGRPMGGGHGANPADLQNYY